MRLPRPKRWLALLFALNTLSVNSADTALPASVSLALKQAGIPESQVGIVVQEMNSAPYSTSPPPPLLAHGENTPFNPASVMKLLTTLAALDSLGPAHTFKTRVLLEGTLGADGVLQGNLILRGGGDPSLSQERFWLLLREVRARGVREIRGDVILDNSEYQIDPIDPAAFDQAPFKPYNAAPNALLVNFNWLTLRLKTSETGPQARFDLSSALPQRTLPQLNLNNQLKADNAACTDWRERIKPVLLNNSTHSTLSLTGSYANACGEQTLVLNLLAPDATTAAFFSALWPETGGLHQGNIRTSTDLSTDPAPATTQPQLLFEFESLPLAQLVRDINKNSNNVMTKMLFLNLGSQRYQAPASWEKSVRALLAWAQERGLDMPELVLENGSGLSRIERISAASLARLLHYAANSPVYYEFAASLPAVGLEGTQKNRMLRSPIAGRAWLKSGTLNDARNLAGYLLSQDTRRLIVIMLVNHAYAANSSQAQAALLEWAAQARVPADVKPHNDNATRCPSE